MSSAGDRRRAITDARRKLNHAKVRYETAVADAESARHVPLGDPQVPDSGRLAPGERSESWIRERLDAAEERYRQDAVAAYAELEDAVDLAAVAAAEEVQRADARRRSAFDAREVESRRAELLASLTGDARLGESRVEQIARLHSDLHRRGDEVGLRALRTDPEIGRAVFDANLTGPNEVTAGNLRSAFRAAEADEYAEVRAYESEVEEYRTGEVARLVADAAAEIRATVPPPPREPEGAEA